MLGIIRYKSAAHVSSDTRIVSEIFSTDYGTTLVELHMSFMGVQRCRVYSTDIGRATTIQLQIWSLSHQDLKTNLIYHVIVSILTTILTLGLCDHRRNDSFGSGWSQVRGLFSGFRSDLIPEFGLNWSTEPGDTTLWPCCQAITVQVWSLSNNRLFNPLAPHIYSRHSGIDSMTSAIDSQKGQSPAVSPENDVAQETALPATNNK